MKKILLLTAMLLPMATVARAESLLALTVTNELLQFDSANPSATSSVSITGLLAGDAIVGIDLRPANGVLYGFATDSGVGGAAAGVGKVYSINTATGVAVLSATLAMDPTDATAPFPYQSVSGSFFGVDFNPVVDRLRVVTDTGQNLRINVQTGLTQLDMPLAYAAADSNVGAPPTVVASAYSNNVAGAGSTTLYGLDAGLSNLATQNPANNGTLNSVALLSLAASADATLDISGATGIGYAVLDGLTLTSLNLATGELTDLGAINTVGSIIGLAAVPEPATLALVSMGSLLIGISRRRRSSLRR